MSSTAMTEEEDPGGSRIGSVARAPGVDTWSLLCLPAVFFLGAPVILVTRVLFHEYHPEWWVNTLPSISKTAAYAPASYLFATGMTVVSICIVVSWSLLFRMNSWRVAALPPAASGVTALRILNLSATIAGWLAALFLFLLSVITLEVDDPVHILLSILFFSAQILSFLIDTAFTLVLRRAARRHHPDLHRSTTGARGLLCLVLVAAGLFYLFMFLVKDAHFFADRMFAQRLYISTEYCVALLSLAYAPSYFPEVRRHFRSIV